MLLSDLQNKDIISTSTGENLGRIIDAEIDREGKVVKIYAEQRKPFRKYFSNNEITFSFRDIEKIGADVILVKL